MMSKCEGGVEWEEEWGDMEWRGVEALEGKVRSRRRGWTRNRSGVEEREWSGGTRGVEEDGGRATRVRHCPSCWKFAYLLILSSVFLRH